jgi:antitoxin (DNA-binding transcriptional repressor) of toxin-antitoxin stability system
MLPPSVQTQLAQQLAGLLQRVRDGEAGHVDRVE